MKKEKIKNFIRILNTPQSIGRRTSLWLTLLSLGVGVTLAIRASSQSDSGYIAHEWGTYTSLVGSNGKEVQGLHHGDEELPNFVHTPVIGTNCSYAGCYSDITLEEGSPLAVTQRLETPVIYFYAKDAMQVSVDVDFPKGVLSEWYPKAQSFAPTHDNFTAVQNGKIRWDVSIKTEALPVENVTPDSVWAPSRNVPANYIESGGENERFIFYRGVGHYTAPFQVREIRHGSLKFSNASIQKVQSAILLQVNEEKGLVHNLGAIPAQGSVTIEHIADLNSNQARPLEEYVTEAAATLKDALIQSGLTDAESQAMVDTWRVSYFKTPGTRILYVAPREWTDQILPIRFSPEPRELVRTLVGRVEILGRQEELKLLGQLERFAQEMPDPHSHDAGIVVNALGKFHEPKLRRARKLALQQNLENVVEFIDNILSHIQ